MIKLHNITSRKASLKDIKDIVCMAFDFFSEFVLAATEDFNFDYVGKAAANIIVGKDQEIFLIHDPEAGTVGMFYVYLAPAYFNPEIKVCEAHHLYLKPEYRNTSAVKVMYNTIREWAKNKGTFWLRDKKTSESIQYIIYKGEEKCQIQSQPQL